MMTQEEHDAIRAREQATTPGPWHYVTSKILKDNGLNTFDCDVWCPNTICFPKELINDIKFIIHARQDIPALLDENAELRSIIAAKDAETARLRDALEAETKRADEAEASIAWYEKDNSLLEKHRNDAFVARDRWKTLAEALERAVKSNDGTCCMCIHIGTQSLHKPPCDKCGDFTNWQFDEARFSAKGAGNGQ